MSAGTKGKAGADYIVERTSPEKLTEAELLRCAAIVRAGCAVRKVSRRRAETGDSPRRRQTGWRDRRRGCNQEGGPYAGTVAKNAGHAVDEALALWSSNICCSHASRI